MTEQTGTQADGAGAGMGANIAGLQRRTVALLCAAQILGGLSMGASLALGAIIGARLAGTDALAGLPTTVLTLGAAAAGLPLASLAARAGRRPALTTGLLIAAAGAGVVALAVDLGWFVLLLVGMAGVGSGTAVSLQARFAATDLAAPATRGRDLSVVVWMTMVGSVVGPALISAGAAVAGWVGMTELSGPFLVGAAGSLLAASVLWLGLRPDPLVVADDIAAQQHSGERPHVDFATAIVAIRGTAGARNALVAVLSAHAVMVAVMALTPVHLSHGGASLTVVGLSISAHIAGMYVLAPIVGLLTDRVGRVPTIVGGQLILVLSCIVGFIAGTGGHSQAGLVIALVLLGIGWSASTVAASTLLTDSVDEAIRPRVQGISDSSMSLAGAAAGVLAGVIVGVFSYSALVLAAALIAIGAVVYLAVDRV